MWIFLGLVSCFFLGFYDIAKKTSLKENAVIPVLFFASLTSAIIFIPIISLSYIELIPQDSIIFVPKIDFNTHLQVFLKSIIVGSSWFFSYIALKHLPITIVTPIRATGPFWTLIGAVLIYEENFSTWQWAGIITVLGFFYFFSLAGNKEGISFKRNKRVYFIILATIIGACSGLYDKFLITNYPRMAVQAWFSIYMVPVFLPFLLFIWYPQRKTKQKFEWRYSIPIIGILLTIADFAYFYALSYEDSLIGIISVLRRTSVVIAFVGGAIIFKEINIKRKAIALTGILIGVLFIVLGS